MTIVYYIASPTWGGGEQYVYDLAKAMKEQYDATTVFILPPHSATHMVKQFQMLGPCPTFQYSAKLWRFSLWGAYQLYRLLRHYNANILHINSRQSYFQSALAKQWMRGPFRLVATQHLVREAKKGLLWEWAYRQQDQLICVSHCVKEKYLQPWKDDTCPFRQVHVIHNSTPIYNSSEPAANPPTPTIFYHGRICAEKGIFPLIHYLEQLQELDFQLIIAGSVAEKDKANWEQLLQQSPIRNRIRYLGFRNDILEIIPTYQIGVIPTLVPEAGGPIALLENMALGLPTITSNNGSQVEFIRHKENGILCNPNAPKEWIESIRLLLTNPQLREKIAQQAKADFFAHHNFNVFIRAMHEIYFHS